MKDEIAISARDVWKRYGKLQVLKGLSLDVQRGETMVIMGRSGVGKSVLLKQVIGMEAPDSGSIIVNGIDIIGMPPTEVDRALINVGMLFQGSALFDSMNVRENVAFFLREHGKPGSGKRYSESEISALVADALEKVDLAGTEKKLPSDLSGGMRRRAALARLIVYRPDIILYDEPTTGLDPITGMQINELIVQIQEDLHATSIVVTHDIQSALFVADRIAFHHDGKIKHCAPRDDFIQIDDPLVHAFIDSSVHAER